MVIWMLFRKGQGMLFCREVQTVSSSFVNLPGACQELLGYLKTEKEHLSPKPLELLQSHFTLVVPLKWHCETLTDQTGG